MSNAKSIFGFLLLLISNQTFAADNDLSIKAEVWADNWFSFYSGDRFIFEDHVPITTERSFNSETFTFKANYPLALNFIIKDFKENDTGLEYIGTRRQQMGDGGFIAQFTDTASGKVIAVTDADWQCTVIHNAPLDKSCMRESDPVAGKAPCQFITKDEPENWKSFGFDDSGWDHATEYNVSDISPKDGYYEIGWYTAARLIWTSDLKAHNTILCRTTIGSSDDLKPISTDRVTVTEMEKRGDKKGNRPGEPPPPPPPPR